MAPFFEAAADYAESKGINLVMRRSEEGEWWAVAVLKDGYGRFEAVVREMEPIRARKETKEHKARAEETFEDFAARVGVAISAAVVKARKGRIGISYGKAQDEDARVAA